MAYIYNKGMYGSKMKDVDMTEVLCNGYICNGTLSDQFNKGVVSKHHLRIKQRNVYSVKGKTKGIVNCYTL